MLEAFVITAREGLEAFLIVALAAAYLRRTDRQAFLPALRWGIAAGLVVSLIVGRLLYSASNQELLDGPLALIAAVSVGWLLVHMWRAGRQMKSEIERRLGGSVARTGFAAGLGVFAFALLMVSREGMETALLLIQLRDSPHVFAGGLAGLGASALLAWAWTRFGRRIDLGLLFQVTAVFLFVFVVQLTIQAVHEMSEQQLLPYSEFIHASTESWGPDSQFGHLLTYLLVVLPAAWCGVRWLSGRPQLATFNGSQRALGSSRHQ